MARDDDRSGFSLTISSPARILLLLAGLLLLWYLADVLLLLFAGFLVAVVILSLAEALVRFTPLPFSGARWLALLLFLAAVFGVGLEYGLGMVRGAQALANAVLEAIERVQAGWMSEEIARAATDAQWVPQLLQRAMGIFSTAMTAIGGLLIILFTGLYFAVEPHVYRDGFLRLVPEPQRSRAAALLQEMWSVLRWFLLGRLASMAIVGGATWIGLSLLGIPFALSLALLAALLEFIPNIGPVLAAVPAVAIAFSQTPDLALWVIALYIALQSIESYLITPLVMQRVVLIPPVLLIGVQLALGVAFGILGLMLAAPIAALGLLLVQRLYLGNGEPR